MITNTAKLFPKFSLKVHSVLSEQFPKTYFVGGAVRNILLGEKVTDIDLATSAQPDEVCALLKSAGVSFSSAHKNMGVIIAQQGKQTVEIATFRKESYGKSRFPKVAFITNPKTDSVRRDFTVNALYYSPVTKELLDFHNGLKDISEKKLKFIGNAAKRITEDPLRIIRAYKFSVQYDLTIDAKTLKILRANTKLLKIISSQRLQKEINNSTSQKTKIYLQKVIHSNT